MDITYILYIYIILYYILCMYACSYFYTVPVPLLVSSVVLSNQFFVQYTVKVKRQMSSNSNKHVLPPSHSASR